MFQMLFLDSKSQQTKHYVTYVKDMRMLYCVVQHCGTQTSVFSE